jgi:tRNA threonylcarbamoyl adenosine modification protein (Sua5/YciO/YrdC/YwlC family)
VKRLPFNQPDEIITATRVAAEVVAAGGVVLLPTESYYGLGADPLQADGVARVCAMKGRATELGMPVLCADWEQLEMLVQVPEGFRVRLSRLWPAPLTVVVPSTAATTASRGGTLAVRIPAHASLRALLYQTGPLTGTSANRHGRPPCTTPDAALASLLGAPDLVLDAGPTAGGEPSTVVDLSEENPRVLRLGACPWDDPNPVC